MSDSFVGLQSLSSASSDLNAVDFMVRMILGELATATVVRVEKVTPPADPLGPAGLVDVLPLVAQVDGAGNAIPHGVVYGLPYFRLQGGSNAVIMDPKPGDLGLAVFASRDISSVKVNKGPSNPGSFRTFDMADGLYLGGFLNGTPTQYVRFSADGVEIVSPTKITLQAPDIQFDGPTHTTGDVTGDATATYAGDVEGDGISLSTHRHGGVTVGGGQTGTPV